MTAETINPNAAPVESAAEYMLKCSCKYWSVEIIRRMGLHIRCHFTPFMKKKDIRNSNGSNALGAARKP
jgi:hypothetical protein